MKQDMPDEWAAAVEFDEAVRHNPLANSGSTAEALYVWQGGEPLAEADLEEAARREKPGRQLPLMICVDGTWWLLDATADRFAVVEGGLITMLNLEG